MYLGLLSVMINQRHFKQLFRRALAPFARAVLLFCTLILIFPMVSTAVFAADTPGIELTPEERAWLKAHPRIVARVDNFPPFHSTVQGKPTGFSIDLLDRIAALAGFDVRYVSNIPFEEIPVKRGKIYYNVAIPDVCYCRL